MANDKFERCVLHVKGQGMSKEEAIRICNESIASAGDDAPIGKVFAAAESRVKKMKLGCPPGKRHVEGKGCFEDDKKKKRESIASYEEIKGVEILRTGVVRGREFKRTDLLEIAQNTNRLIEEGVHNPPVKLGHEDAQTFAKISGLPATGWIENIRVVGNRMIADFVDVPKMVFQAIQKRLFDKISAEIYFDLPHPNTGNIMGKVLRASAILGADIPEVKGMVPLRALLSDLEDHPVPAKKEFAPKEGEVVESLQDIMISITIPDQQAPAAAADPMPDDGPTVVDKVPVNDPDALAGEDLEVFRDAEKVAKDLHNSGTLGANQEGTVESLVAYYAKDGGISLETNERVRQMVDNVERLFSWLRERAAERDLLKAAEKKSPGGETVEKAELVKLEEEQRKTKEQLDLAEKGKAEAEAKVAKYEAEIAEQKKAASLKAFDAFCEKHKEHIIPAVKPALMALHDAIAEGPIVVKLDEKTEEKIPGQDLVLKFAEELIKAKVVRFEEVAKTSKKSDEVVEAHAGNRVDLAEKADELMKTEKYIELAKNQPAHKVYGMALSEAASSNPELTKAEA